MFVRGCRPEIPTSSEAIMRAQPDLKQGPADLQSAALTTELYTQMLEVAFARIFVILQSSVATYCDVVEDVKSKLRLA